MAAPTTAPATKPPTRAAGPQPPPRGPQFQRHHKTFWTSADTKCCCSEGAANGKADAGFRETTSIETLASARRVRDSAFLQLDQASSAGLGMVDFLEIARPR